MINQPTSRLLLRYWLILTTLIFVLGGYLLAIWYQDSSNFITRVYRLVFLPAWFLLCAGSLLKKENSNERVLLLKNWSAITSSTVAVILYIILLTSLKLKKWSIGNYEFFDAGLYAQKLQRLSEKDFFSSLFATFFDGHFQPVITFYLIPYKYFGGMPTVMTLETIGLALGSIVVFKIASILKLCNVSKVLAVVAYLSSPLLAFNDILGFHPDHIVLPALLWAFYFATTQRTLWLVGALLLICISGEQWIPTVSFLGVYIFFFLKQRTLGIGLAVGSIIMLCSIYMFLLNPFSSNNSLGALLNPTYGQSAYAKALSFEFNALLELLTEPRKIFFGIFVIFPALFTLMFAPQFLVVMLPDIAKIGLSSEPLHYSLEGHYTLAIIAIITVISIAGIASIKKRFGIVKSQRVSFIVTLSSVLLTICHGPLPFSYNFWAKWSGGAFHYSNYQQSVIKNDFEKLLQPLSSEPNISISISNDMFHPVLLNFDRIEIFPYKMPSEVVAISKSRFHNTGADLANPQYRQSFKKELEKLGDEYLLFADEAAFQIYKLKDKPPRKYDY